MKVLLGLLLSSSVAFAGIADSPLPVLETGKRTLHLFSVPGVINDGGSTWATFFSCTSTSTTSQTVAVELFAAGGGDPVNNANATQLTVAAGQTVTFGTTFAANLFTDIGLTAPSMKGSARILSTSTNLICSVLIADAMNSTPTSVTGLSVISKTTQKGQ